MSSESGAELTNTKEETIWCGGGAEEGGQDVTVRLMQHEQAVLVIKLHSSHLKRCSKYFETCMSERWRNSSSDFVLEVQADINHYTDCFTRMYTPFLKHFGPIQQSLELLKVASQIEFRELMDSISRYISAVPWSCEDELRIREYASSPDFPLASSPDLIARLGLHMTNQDRHDHMVELIKQAIQTALYADGSWKNTRAFFEDFLSAIGAAPCARILVSIVSTEAKNMFAMIEKECEQEGFYHLVPKFTEKLLSICWVLNALLHAGVGEELVQYLVQLDTFASIVANVSCFNGPEACKMAAFELAKLILHIYNEVMCGHLLLSTSERTALLKNWHCVLENHVSRDSYLPVTKDFFLTLPLEQQTELIKFRKDKFTGYIDTGSLVTLLKKSWPALEPNELPSSEP